MPWGQRNFSFFAGAPLVLAVLLTTFICSPVGANPAATLTPQGAGSAVSSAHPSSAHKSASTAKSHTPAPLTVKSRIALVEDVATSKVLFEKNADEVTPIASITKLMTAMVALDAKLSLQDMLTISDEDRDMVLHTTSRLNVGWSLSREDMLHLALMSSENRAAAALSRYYPGGREAFIKAMNDKAEELGMASTHFVNPNGLTDENISTAFDLVKLVEAANRYPLIRQYSTDPGYAIQIGRHVLDYYNTNRLIGNPDWDIEVQKTGFTNLAGECLVMRTNVDGRGLIMIFMDAVGKLTRFADARRVRQRLALDAPK